MDIVVRYGPTVVKVSALSDDDAQWRHVAAMKHGDDTELIAIFRELHRRYTPEVEYPGGAAASKSRGGRSLFPAR